jgi:hypothetical protein
MDSDSYTINHKTGRLIKKGSKLHLKLVKEKLLKQSSKPEFKIASDSEEEEYKRYVPNKLPPRKTVKTVKKHKKYSDIDTMNEDELTDLESYIRHKLEKCEITEESNVESTDSD